MANVKGIENDYSKHHVLMNRRPHHQLASSIKPVRQHVFNSDNTPYYRALAMCSVQTSLCQPLYTMKLAKHLNSTVQLTARRLFRGTWGNLYPKIPYYMAMCKSQDVMKDMGGLERSLITGLVSTPFIQSAEHATTYRQYATSKVSFLSFVAKQPHVLLNGLSTMAARELIFSGLFWYVRPSIESKLPHDTPFKPLIAASLSGAIIAPLTSPFDYISSLFRAEKVSKFNEVPGLKELLSGRGSFQTIQPLFKGLGWRTAYIVWAINVLTGVEKTFDIAKLPSS